MVGFGDIVRNVFQTVLAKYGKVAFVDLQRGDTEGYVRFDDAAGAAAW